jgi:1,4-alpha-glucan branching enzyme
MLKKNYTPTKKVCRVTFKYPNEEQHETAAVCGDFNKWSPTEHQMKRLKDGSFSLTVSLPASQAFAYRYVLDGNVWVNDPDADQYRPNEFGEENSVVVI